ncbi:sodium channel protein Nach-like [Euwallacea similis]|uniref:sodium channel protein Nach-like n=1 Tax=Euwallacea similis TaxID=1736056 RepID=UPI00344FEFC1
MTRYRTSFPIRPVADGLAQIHPNTFPPSNQISGMPAIPASSSDDILDKVGKHSCQNVNGRHRVEKVFWTVVLLVSFSYGWYFNVLSINRYWTNPVMISIERDRFSWSTPLPAVTICPLENIDEQQLELVLASRAPKNITKMRKFLSSLFYANLSNLGTILEDADGEIEPEEYVSTILNLQKKSIAAVMASGQWLDPKEGLHQIITEMGICYCFNSHLALHFSLEYWNASERRILPEVPTFDLHPLDGENFAYIANITTSFNVYFHGAHEVPDVRRTPIFMAKDCLMQVYFEALSIISSDDTKALTIKQRKCRFYHESNLTHFPVYSYMLCRMECRIQLSLQLCGCVPHFYRNQKFEKICDSAGLRCLSQNQDQLISLEPSGQPCYCEANCEEVNYVLEDVDTRVWFLGSNLQYGLRKFPEMRFKRVVIFKFYDLLVYMGGVGGLFHGASVLSFIELFYYYTLRFFWSVYKKQH